MRQKTKQSIVVKLISMPLLALVFNACEAPEGDQYKVEVNKPYYLKEMPDAKFIKELDSLLDSEQIVETVREKNKIALEISANPRLIDPSKINKVQESLKLSETKEEMVSLTSEDKLDRFLEVLDQWSKDSENKKFFRSVRVKEGQENIRKVLRANYGQWTEALPEAIIQFSLEAQNRDLNLSDLKVGQVLRLPKL